MSNCNQCQAPLAPETNFCPGCGTSQVADTEPCAECGKPIQSADVFCSHCGQSREQACLACGIGVEAGAAVCPDCGFNIEEGTSKAHAEEDTQRAREVLALIDAPVTLRQLKKRHRYLMQGDMDPDYVRVIEAALMLGKSQPIVNLQLASFPRQWAIQKVGLIRRLLTLVIDGPVLLGLFLGGMVVFVGKADEPGLLGLTGGAKAGFIWGWAFVCYLVYCVGTELIFGATLGGLLCGVRVVNKFGRSQSLNALFKRNAIKLIPIIGPYAMAAYVKPDHEVVKS